MAHPTLRRPGMWEQYKLTVILKMGGGGGVLLITLTLSFQLSLYRWDWFKAMQPYSKRQRCTRWCYYTPVPPCSSHHRPPVIGISMNRLKSWLIMITKNCAFRVWSLNWPRQLHFELVMPICPLCRWGNTLRVINITREWVLCQSLPLRTYIKGLAFVAA